MSNTVRKPFTLDRIVRIVIGLLILICAGLLINRLSSVLFPFLLAWLMAYLMYPLLSFYQYKLRMKNRIPAIFATLVTVFGLITLALFFLLPPVISEVQKAYIIVNKMISESQLGFDIPPAILETVQNFLANITIQDFDFNNIDQLVKLVLPQVWKILSGAGSIVMNVFLAFMVLLYLIFILKDYEKISNNWINLIPKHYRPFVLHVGEDLKIGMNKYFRGQALIAFIVSILFSVGFSIISLPLGIVLGLIAGLMNMIPYLQTVTIIPALLLGAIKASEYHQNFLWIAVSILAIYAVVQVIEDMILVPKIMGKATGLNPAIILLSLSVWGSLFGMVGMILALPMTTLISSYYNRFVIKGGFLERLVVNQENDSVKKTEEKEESITSEDTVDS